MLESLKQEVYDAVMDIKRHNLVILTWGNASGIDRERGLFVIKPSGVEYDKLTPSMMVVMSLDGKKIEGDLSPSSDTKTHMVLYNAFPEIGGIVHTHSTWATAAAQAGTGILPLGTTHADYFYGEIPCTRDMTEAEIGGDYELETGNLIVETFRNRNINPAYVPAVLVKNHGPFTWGTSSGNAVENAVVLEEISKMMAISHSINASAAPVSQFLLGKHFFRKHGENAYYGQSV